MNQTIRQTASIATLAVTGAYLHDPKWCADVAFETGTGSDRHFTLLIAQGVMKGSDPTATNGIAIIDTASGKIVCDGICAKADPTQVPAMDQRLSFNLIEAMDWSAFSSYLRTRPTYRGGFPDIDSGSEDPDTAVPTEGDLVIDRTPSDLRAADLKAMNMATDVPYSFPASDRAKMIADISRNKIFVSEGESALCWDIRMGFRWNASGIIRGGAEVDPDMNDQWAQTCGVGSETFTACANEAVAPYVSGAFVPLEREGASAIVLEQRGAQGGFLVMTSIAGQDIAFADREELAIILDALDDNQISDLWASCRVLDIDLGRAARSEEMEWRMHDARVAFEAAADATLVDDEAVDYAM